MKKYPRIFPVQLLVTLVHLLVPFLLVVPVVVFNLVIGINPVVVPEPTTGPSVSNTITITCTPDYKGD